ncbi:MAG: diguanylate cyclase, partial [Dictyoglomaceae bacterium]|nr:diguanylate cyclase [Dictyoglomaceae bacterium]
MKIGFGYSFNENPYIAGKEATERAIKASGTPIFTLIFNTYNYYQEALLKGIKELIPFSKIVGFSGDGLIIQDKLYRKGIGIITLSGENLKVDTFLEEKRDRDDYSLGEILGKKILKTGINKGTIFIFPDSFKIDVSLLLYGLFNTLGKKFNFIGGGVGRISKDYKAFVFTEEGIIEGGISLAVIEGIDFSISCGHGWKPLGDPLIITKAENKEIIEIDGRSAFLSYKEKLGEFPYEKFSEYAINNPLGFPNLLGNFLIRDPIGVKDKEKLIFGTKIYTNSVGYIMKGDIAELLESSRITIEKAIKYIKNPQFALIFDCISRSDYMGENFEKELRIIRESFPLDIPILGMLSFGEIETHNKIPLFHNKSLVIGIGGEEVIKEEKRENIFFPLYAELSILHEISSFSLPSSEKDLYEEIAEKAGRLFDIQLFALLLKTRYSYKLASSLGFTREEEVLELMKEKKPNQFTFQLGDGNLGILFIEQEYPLENKEIKIYTIFARKIENLLKELYNIKKQKELEENLRRLSLTDELTGLYNRRGFITLAEQQLKIFERVNKRGILIYIDLDNMKEINDTFGHLEGDKYLRNFVDILRKSFRKSDIIARIGGDEFVILCMETSETSIERLLLRLYQNIYNFNS